MTSTFLKYQLIPPVDEAKAKLEDGSFNVFDGVIETNDGKTVGEEGKTLDDATITGDLSRYFFTHTFSSFL